jgi:hypothetical protein
LVSFCDFFPGHFRFLHTNARYHFISLEANFPMLFYYLMLIFLNTLDPFTSQKVQFV